MSEEKFPSQEDSPQKPTPEDMEGLEDELEKTDKILLEQGLLKGVEEEEEEEVSDSQEAEDPEESKESPMESWENEAEKRYNFDRFSVAEMIDSGASDEEVWEAAKQAGVFFKYDGSSYYLSDDNYDDSGKYQWRRRSAANNTSGGYPQRRMFDHVKRELGKYRELKGAYDNLKDSFQAADILHANGEKPTMNKMLSISEYWDEISSESTSQEKSTHSEESEQEDMANATDEGSITELEAESQEMSELSESEPAEEQQSENKSTESEDQESVEETPEISVGDAVYLMEGELQRWRDPKPVKKIYTIEGQEYAKVEGGDGLYPLEKLKLDPKNAEYRPGPGKSKPYKPPIRSELETLDESGMGAGEVTTSAEDFEDTPMPDELADVEGAEEIAQEIEGMSQEEREQTYRWWQNLGHKAEQGKAWLQRKAFQGLSDSFNKINSQSTMARWITALKDQATKKEQKAKEAILQREEVQKDGSDWEKVKESLKDKWKVTANLLKGGSMFFSPHRWFMLGGLAVSSGAEAGKEARFNNVELMEATRFEDAEAAAEEAWAIYEQAEKKAGGDLEVTKEIIQDAYTKNLPENILRRLGEYEEFELKDETIYDIDKAHEEALRIQEEAENMADKKGVSTENLQSAFEKLFEDPKPGQNSAFVGKLFEKQIVRLAKKTQHKFLDIELDDSLTDEEKEAKKQEYLNKWGRSKALQDYDRMITEEGKVDGWAMAAHETERVGKGVVAATMAHTFWKTINLLPDLFTDAETVAGDGGEIGVDSTGIKPEEGPPFVADTTDTSSIFAEIDPDSVISQPDTAQVDTADTAGVQPDSIAQDEATPADSIVADSVAADTTDTTEMAVGDTLETTQPDTATADTVAMPEVPTPPEVTAEALGPQSFTIDESGEGMIHAIADKLEADYDLSHEKAMEIGNKLYIKGEQMGGNDEMFNLVGKGSSFELDFGDLTPEDLQNQPSDELVKTVDFDQANFDAGDSGVEPAEELPVTDPGDSATDLRGENPIESVKEIDDAYINEEPGMTGAEADTNVRGENPIERVKEIDDVQLTEDPGMTEKEVQDFQKRAQEAGVTVEDSSLEEGSASEASDRPVEAISGDEEALRAAVDKVPESHIRAKVVHSSALLADNSELVADLPETRLNVLGNLLERYADSNTTSETILKITEDDPRLLTVLERALTADHVSDEPLSPNDQNVLAFVRQQVSKLSPADFAGEMPDYVLESMEASRQQ